QTANLEPAIAAAAPEELSIVVTDLYQERQYFETITDIISDKLATIPQGAVGVVGVRSEFDGTVYTEAERGTGSFAVSSAEAAHPFYIVFVGRVDEVSFYMKDLKQRLTGLNFQEGVEYTVFSPERIYETLPVQQRKSQSAFREAGLSEVSVPENRMRGDRIGVNLQDPAVQPLQLKQGGQDDVIIPYQIPLNQIEDTFLPSNLSVVFQQSHTLLDEVRKEFAGEDATVGGALSVENASISPSQLDFSLNLSPQDFRNRVSFFTLDAAVVPAGSGGPSFSQKEGWAGWSSTSSETDGRKTHNLDKFLDGLAINTTDKMRSNNISVGQYCYLIKAS
ncbi:MAG: hypothetical protein AAFY72_16825, partial [Cyanobacteria bacterium J06649_4]